MSDVTWGPVYDDDILHIELPDGNWVDVKRYITAQDQAAAQNAARATRKEGADEMSFSTGSYSVVLLQRLVKAWSFSRNGAAIPCEPKTVAMLPIHTRDYIMERIDAANKPATEEQAENLERPMPTSFGETEPALLN